MATTISPTVPPVAAKRPLTFGRVIGKVIGWLFKTIVALTIIVILTPIAFFAWRAGKPLERPEFSGLTLYQYETWRFESYKANAAQFQATHPDAGARAYKCYVSDSAVLVFAPWSEFYALAGKFSALRRIINPRDYKYIPTNVTWATLPTSWWSIYESMILSTFRGDGHNPLVYCRLPQYPPTLEEWEQSHP